MSLGTEEKDYTYLQDQYEESKERVDLLYKDLNTQKEQIKILKDEIDLIDTTVFNADKHELDSLFEDFFKSAR